MFSLAVVYLNVTDAQNLTIIELSRRLATIRLRLKDLH